MNREQDVLKAAYEVADIDSDVYHTQIDCFIKGAEWADSHPRLDVAGPTSATRVRMILLRKFINVAKQYPDKTMDEVPEIKEAFDLVNNLDKCCEVAGFTLNDDTGFYNIPE